MNAIQPSTPHLTPVETRRRVVRRQALKRQQRHPYRAIAAETTAKLAVNVVISVVAVSALAKLLPYQQKQQEQLREIGVKVEETEERVEGLNAQLERLMAPEQAKSIMQEYSYRVDPNKIRIAIEKRNSTAVEDPNE